MKKEYIERYKAAKTALTQQKKNEVMEFITNPMTAEEIEKYSMGMQVPELTEFQIKLEYLKSNSAYFTREERLELMLVLAQNNNLSRTK